MPLRLDYVSTLANSTDGHQGDRMVTHLAEANRSGGIAGMLPLEERGVCKILDEPKEVVTPRSRQYGTTRPSATSS